MPSKLSSKRPKKKNQVHCIHDARTNHEDFTIIWLDTNNQENEVQCRLRRIINYLKLFDNVSGCVNYVASIKTERVFLITSGALSNNLIPKIHDYSQVERIYIFCHQTFEYDSLVQSYSKISGAFSNSESLLTKLKRDFQTIPKNFFLSSIFTPERSIYGLDEESSTFVWFPLLIETVTRMNQSEKGKEDLLAECQLEYIDNEYEQKLIEEFRLNYQANDALLWYTRDCFLYRLLNKAFRLQDITTIFKFRFFLADLNNQLKKLHFEYIKSIPSNRHVLTFYRGQTLSMEEIEKLTKNIGKMISIHTYFSTTVNCQVALMFAGNGEQRPFIESVLFQIDVEYSLINTSKPFANIGHVSFMKDENEVLFSPGIVFILESVDEYDCLWHVHLRLISEEKFKELTQVVESLKQEDNCESPLLSLGFFLWKFAQYDKAKLFFTMLLQDKSTSKNHSLTSVIYNNIGLLYNDQGNYRKALKYYAKSVKFGEKTRHSTAGDRASTLNNIGIIYANRNKNKLALKYYKLALKLQLGIRNPRSVDFVDLATTHSNIGCIYGFQKLFSLALIKHEKALSIQLEHLPKGHPDIGRTYNNIGYVYLEQGNYKKALENYQTALASDLIALPDNHPDLSTAYNNVGSAYNRLENYLLAIEHLEKAIEIDRKSLPKDHLDFAQTYQSIAHCYHALKDDVMALDYLNKTLNIELGQAELDHFLLNKTYIDIAVCYESMKNISTALNNYKLGLKYAFRIKPKNHSRINLIQKSIQRCRNLLGSANNN